MKILHVIPSVGPARGGPSQAVLAMTRALRCAGVEADIVTTNDNGTALLPVKTDSWQVYEEVNVFFFHRWSPSVAALREFQYAPGFDAWLETHLPDYDGVHIHAIFSFLPTRAMSICRRLGIPFIARPLGQLDPWSMNQKFLKKRIYYKLIEKQNLMAAGAIHCTSETEARHVRALLPEARIEVIPHGIAAPETKPDAASQLRQKWSIASDRRVLLYLSRWHPKKNIPLLLQALSRMRDDSWVLILAGTTDDTNYKDAVHQAILDYDLNDHVICPGHVQGNDKDLLLAGSDLFVLPSITENFGVAVAEALCSGLPCVVAEGVDLAPVVCELSGGIVCKPEASAIIEALCEALRMHFNRRQLSHDARKHFSWDKVATTLKTLYMELFAPHYPPSRQTSTTVSLR